MHTFAFALFPHLHGIGRFSGKEILIMFDLLLHQHLLAVCSRTQMDQLPNFLQIGNVTKHAIAECMFYV